MEEVIIVLEQDYDKFKAGNKVKVKKDFADELIEMEVAKLFDAEADEKAKKEFAAAKKQAEEDRNAYVTETVKAVMAELSKAKNAKGNPIFELEVTGDNILKDKRGGFKRLGHFASDLIKAASGEVTETLKTWGQISQKADMTEGVDSAGGYLAPPEFASVWFPPALENSIVAPRAFSIPMATNHLKMPALLDSDHSSGIFGTLAAWEGEIDQMTGQNLNLNMLELTLHNLQLLIPVSDDLISDSMISLEAFLNQIIPMTLTFKLDEAFLTGTGAGMPLGALNAANPALIAVAKATNQSADTVVYQNIVDMWARFYMVNPNSTAWIIDRSVFPQLAFMTINVGTGGAPVYLPADKAAGRPFSTLLGIPVIPTEKVPVLGNQGDISLVDFSQYIHGQKGDIEFAQSMHLYFDRNKRAFRWKLRADGQSAWLSAMTPANGGSTLSPFVTLAERA